MKKGLLFLHIMTKRLLLKKSFWVMLLITIFTTAMLTGLERTSKRVLYAAVYAEEENLARRLQEYEGFVQFFLCVSEEEVRQYVMQGKAECGYVLKEDLQKEILEGRGNWSIEVYESSDSTLTWVINEVLFEKIFYEVSTDWYEGYIAANTAFLNTVEERGEEAVRKAASEAFLEKLSDGSTFTLERSRLQAAETKEQQGSVSYPVSGGVGLCILLCMLTGVSEAMTDRIKGSFFRYPAAAVSTVTIALPTGFGYLTGILTLWLAGSEALTATRAVFLFLIAIICIGMGVLLHGILRKPRGNRRG